MFKNANSNNFNCKGGNSNKLYVCFILFFLISKRFFGIPEFYNYAIADGIYNCLYSTKYGIEYSKKNEKIIQKSARNTF